MAKLAITCGLPRTVIAKERMLDSPGGGMHDYGGSRTG